MANRLPPGFNLDPLPNWNPPEGFRLDPLEERPLPYMDGAQPETVAERFEGTPAGRYDYENQPLGKAQARVDLRSAARATVRDAERAADIKEAAAAPEDDWATLGRKMISRVVPIAKRQAGGALQWLAESGYDSGDDAFLATDLAEMRNEYQAKLDEARARGEVPGQKLAAEAQRDLEENGYNFGDSTSKYYATMIGENLVQMVPTVLATIATRSPAPGMAAMGGQVAGGQYADSRDAGRSPGAATADAIFMGAAELIGERVPLGMLIRPGGTFLKNTLKTAGAEGVQEMFTQVMQTGYSAGVLKEDMTWGQAVRSVVDAGIIGAGMGAGMSTIAQPFRRPETPGIVETANATPSLTPDDLASPLPNDALNIGKTVMQGVVAKTDADAVLARNAMPAIGKRVDFMGQEATIADAFRDEDGEGVTVEIGGQQQKVYFSDLADAGVSLTEIAAKGPLYGAMPDPAKGDAVDLNVNAPVLEPSESSQEELSPQPQISAGLPAESAQEELGTAGQLKARIRRVESSGNDAANNPLSSADGRYQFTDGTWKRLHQRVYGGDGIADKFNPEKQERLMDALLDENRAALRAEGVTPDAGNMYAAHHFGAASAIRMAKNPDAPLRADYQKANPHLRGMTNGQALEWARGHVGDGSPLPGTAVAAADTSTDTEDSGTTAALLAEINREPAAASAEALAMPMPEAPASESVADIGPAGAAIVDNMYAALFEKIGRGETTENGQPSALLQVAKAINDAGGIVTPQNLPQIAAAYASAPEQGQERQVALRQIVADFTPSAAAQSPAVPTVPQSAPASQVPVAAPTTSAPTEPIAVDFETYAAQRGANRLDFGDAGAHTRGHKSEASHRRSLKAIQENDRELAERREQLRVDYDAAVEQGELRPLTSQERLQATAAGDPNRVSTQAAQRVLAKRAARAAEKSTPEPAAISSPAAGPSQGAGGSGASPAPVFRTTENALMLVASGRGEELGSSETSALVKAGYGLPSKSGFRLSKKGEKAAGAIATMRGTDVPSIDGKARSQQDARVPNLEGDQAALLEQGSVLIPQVRRERQGNSPGVGGRLPRVSQGDRSEANPAALSGPDRQREGVRAGERSLGDQASTEAKHSVDAPDDRVQRQEAAGDRLVERDGAAPSDNPVADPEGAPGRRGVERDKAAGREAAEVADIQRNDAQPRGVGEADRPNARGSKREIEEGLANREGLGGAPEGRGSTGEVSSVGRDRRADYADQAAPVEAWSDVASDLYDRLKQLKIGDKARLELVGLLFNPQTGQPDRRVAGRYFNDVITVALGSVQDPNFTISHEAWHFFDENMIRPAERVAMNKAALADEKLMASIRQRYPDLSPAQQLEEARADLFAMRGGFTPKGFVRDAFDRIIYFLKSLGEALRLHFLTADDVIAAIERGDVGARPGRLSGPERQRLMMAWDGATPQDEVKGSNVDATPDTRRTGSAETQDGEGARLAARGIPEEPGPEGLGPKFSLADPIENEAFRRWSNDAPLIRSSEAGTHQFKTGEKVVVEAFHGTARPDRVGTVFQRNRATSGPMAFFTSDPTLASNYSTAKADTSIAEEEHNYERWYKYQARGMRSPVDIVRAWFQLDPETRDRIAERAPQITTEEDGDRFVIEPGNTRGNGAYDYEIEQTKRQTYDRRGNPLKALVESWLTSGSLFGQEERFQDVLKLAGFPMQNLIFDDPNAQHSFVYKTYIAMQRPLVTNDVPDEVIGAFKAMAQRDRSRADSVGRDMWDKRTVTPREWVQTFLSERADDRSFGWTRIPDKITETLKSLGYDGIIDWSGKGGGAEHPVYIPFQETQVKSATGNRGTFDPAKKDIRYSIVGEPDTDPQQLSDLLNRTTAAVVGWGSLKGKATDFVDAIRVPLQDRMLPVLRTQIAAEKALGRPIAENENPYREEELMVGRVGAALEQLTEKHIDPLFEAMREKKITPDELETYIYARHAPERNAEIAKINPAFAAGGGSGMTDLEAKAIMARIRKEGRLDAFEQVAALYDGLRDFSISFRVETGLMSQEQADEWRTKYPHYAPLKGFSEMNERPSTSKGISVRGPESKRAFGRRSKAEDILAHTIMQAEEAIVRGHKNLVAQEFYNLAKAAKDDTFWKLHKVQVKREVNPDTGMMEEKIVTELAPGDENYTVFLKVNGEHKRVTMQRGNPAAERLAAAMRRLDETKMNLITRLGSQVNRYLSTVNTALNPEFVITNAFRDFQTATANLAGIDVEGIIGGTVKDYPAAMKASMKGAFKKDDGGAWAKSWQEFTLAGGRVFYNQMQDIEQLRRDIAKRIQRSQLGVGGKRRTAAEMAMLAKSDMKAVLDFIGNVNLGVENAIRLSAFKNARERGMSVKDAAAMAKNLTVNFNKKGTWGVALNSMYLFYNASVQGSARIMLGLKHKGVRRVVYGMIATGAAVELLNVMLSGADDDGEPYYDKISDFDKSRNLIIMTPWMDGAGGKGSHIKIPLPYGYNAFYAVGRAGSEIGRGKPFWHVFGNLAGTFVDAFNPIGGTDSLANFIAPTLVDPAIDLFVDNRDFADKPIMPDQPQYGPPVPDNQRYWASVAPHWKAVTDFMNKASGGDDVVPGSVDVSPETLEYMFGTVVGAAGAFVDRSAALAFKVGQKMEGDPDVEFERNDFPMVRKLVGSKPGWYDKAAFYTRLEEIEGAVADAKDYREIGDEAGLDRLIEDRGDILDLRKLAKAARKEMKSIRKDKSALELAHERGTIDDAFYKERKSMLLEDEQAVITRFNQIYFNSARKPIGPQ